MNKHTRASRAFSLQRIRLASLVLASILLTLAPSSAQAPKPLSGGALPNSPPGTALVSLPVTAADFDRELRQLEGNVVAVRALAAAAAPEATPEELVERQALFQQWLFALDAQSSSLQRLQEVRRLNQSRVAEAQAWSGFAEQPPYPLALVEGLRDAIGSQELEMQTDQVLLSISESSVARGTALLEECRKQVRQARDQAELTVVPEPQLLWALRLAERRVESSEAMLAASAVARLITAEQLADLRQYLEFLKRKLAAAQLQAGFSRADLDEVLARLQEAREQLRQELSSAIANHTALSLALATAREDLRRAQADAAGATAERIQDLRASVDAEQTRCATGEIKVELLRSFLFLSDHTEAIWEDRFWATGERSLAELRSKRQSHQDSFEKVRPWRKLAELRLAGSSSEALGQSIRASAANLTAVERASAKQIEVSFEERARLYQRALSALMLLEGIHERLLADLAEREAKVSFASRALFALERTGSFCRRIWDTELYVAEDSVIADGQKISVPRAVTLGKVVIALGILLVGVLLAHWGRRGVQRTASRWFGAGEQTADALAKSSAAIAVIVAFCAAMTSVRIPWTVFAFLGGALAIGVGFGAQTLINNFISGVILLFDRSIRVGDIVEVGAQRGKVRRMGFRNSLIRRGDGIDVLVPNSRFLETEVVNWTLTDDLVRYKIPVGVAYGSPLETVSALIAQAALEHPNVVQDPAPHVQLDDFGDNALVFTLVFWMRLQPPADGGIVRSGLRCRIHALFATAGIALAFPQRDVHLDSAVPLAVRLVRSEPASDPVSATTPPP